MSGIIGWTVLGIIGVLAVLSTALLILIVADLRSIIPARRSKGKSVAEYRPVILAGWLLGLSSFLLWVLFAIVLYFTW